MPIFLDQPIGIEWLVQNREHLWGEAYACYLEEPDQKTDTTGELSEAAKPFHERATAKDMLEERVLNYFADTNPHSFYTLQTHDIASLEALSPIPPSPNMRKPVRGNDICTMHYARVQRD